MSFAGTGASNKESECTSPQDEQHPSARFEQTPSPFVRHGVRLYQEPDCLPTLLTQAEPRRLIGQKGRVSVVNCGRVMRRMLGAALLLCTNCALHAQSNSLKPAYDFSLPREERIKLAESAAPPEISGKATVSLLERTG
jgi:hypothetical protein